MEEPLPQDAVRIEYLGFSGSQYIDTLFKANTTKTSLNISLLFYDLSQRGIFGSRNAIAANSGACALMSIGGGMRPMWATGGTNTLSASKDVLYNMYITRGTFKLNDATYTYPYSSVSVDQEYHFLIGNFTNGSANPYSSGLNGRVYSAVLYHDGIVTYDFIPVRVGTTGYLYDRISKQLFGNAGTGDFILGPDK